MATTVSNRFLMMASATLVSTTLLVGCGGGSSSGPAPAPVVEEPSEPGGAPLRYSGTAPDIDVPGPYAVSDAIDYKYFPVDASEDIVEDTSSPDLHTTTKLFDEQVDILGVIRYPVLPAGESPPAGGFPVILFQHGRHSTCSTTGDESGSESSGTDCEADGLVPIRSDLGYDYIAETMASHGYVVLSIDVNDINAMDSASNDQGITARAEVILHHLDIFRDINDNAASSYVIDENGNSFAALKGVMDLDSIGLMGHSRGGNGVAKTITYNQDERFRRSSSFDAPHEIKAVFSLAPTDFNSELPLNTAWVTLSPYCDGDVSTLHGVYMYDNVRYDSADTLAPQYQITSMGANHNFYNDFWFNDDADLNGGDPYCTLGSPVSGRYSRPDQRRHGEFLIASFLRLHAGGEEQFAGYWNALERAPTSACPEGAETCDERLHLSFHQQPDQLVVVDSTLTNDSLNINSLGMTNSFSGFTETGWCEPNGGSLDDVLGMNQDACPSTATISKAPQVFGRWQGLSPSITWTLSETGLDASEADFFTLRMGVAVTQDNATGQDFTLTLTDIHGVSAQALASDYSDALYFPPGLTASARDTGAKTVVNMVPFRLDAQPWVESGIDLSQLVSVTVDFDQTLSGTIQLTDVLFQTLPSTAAGQ